MKIIKINRKGTVKEGITVDMQTIIVVVAVVGLFIYHGLDVFYKYRCYTDEVEATLRDVDASTLKIPGEERSFTFTYTFVYTYSGVEYQHIVRSNSSIYDKDDSIILRINPVFPEEYIVPGEFIARKRKSFAVLLITAVLLVLIHLGIEGFHFKIY